MGKSYTISQKIKMMLNKRLKEKADFNYKKIADDINKRSARKPRSDKGTKKPKVSHRNLLRTAINDKINFQENGGNILYF